jgi:translation initiation factor 2 subunit 1
VLARVQDAMRKAEAVSTEETEVKMKLVAPPLYVLTTQTLDKAEGLDLLGKACEACQKAIEACKVRYTGHNTSPSAGLC